MASMAEGDTSSANGGGGRWAVIPVVFSSKATIRSRSSVMMRIEVSLIG